MTIVPAESRFVGIRLADAAIADDVAVLEVAVIATFACGRAADFASELAAVCVTLVLAVGDCGSTEIARTAWMSLLNVVPKSDEAALSDRSIGTTLSTAAKVVGSPLLPLPPVEEDGPPVDWIWKKEFATVVAEDDDAGGVNGAAKEFANVVNALANASLALEVKLGLFACLCGFLPTNFASRDVLVAALWLVAPVPSHFCSITIARLVVFAPTHSFLCSIHDSTSSASVCGSALKLNAEGPTRSSSVRAARPDVVLAERTRTEGRNRAADTHLSIVFCALCPSFSARLLSDVASNRIRCRDWHPHWRSTSKPPDVPIVAAGT